MVEIALEVFEGDSTELNRLDAPRGREPRRLSARRAARRLLMEQAPVDLPSPTTSFQKRFPDVYEDDSDSPPSQSSAHRLCLSSSPSLDATTPPKSSKNTPLTSPVTDWDITEVTPPVSATKTPPTSDEIVVEVLEPSPTDGANFKVVSIYGDGDEFAASPAEAPPPAPHASDDGYADEIEPIDAVSPVGESAVASGPRTPKRAQRSAFDLSTPISLVRQPRHFLDDDDDDNAEDDDDDTAATMSCTNLFPFFASSTSGDSW